MNAVATQILPDLDPSKTSEPHANGVSMPTQRLLQAWLVHYQCCIYWCCNGQCLALVWYKLSTSEAKHCNAEWTMQPLHRENFFPCELPYRIMRCTIYTYPYEALKDREPQHGRFHCFTHTLDSPANTEWHLRYARVTWRPGHVSAQGWRNEVAHSLAASSAVSLLYLLSLIHGSPALCNHPYETLLPNPHFEMARMQCVHKDLNSERLNLSHLPKYLGPRPQLIPETCKQPSPLT